MNRLTILLQSTLVACLGTAARPASSAYLGMQPGPAIGSEPGDADGERAGTLSTVAAMYQAAIEALS